jgi:hypothetical protein
VLLLAGLIVTRRRRRAIRGPRSDATPLLPKEAGGVEGGRLVLRWGSWPGRRCGFGGRRDRWRDGGHRVAQLRVHDECATVTVTPKRMLTECYQGRKRRECRTEGRESKRTSLGMSMLSAWWWMSMGPPKGDLGEAESEQVAGADR